MRQCDGVLDKRLVNICLKMQKIFLGICIERRASKKCCHRVQALNRSYLLRLFRLCSQKTIKDRVLREALQKTSRDCWEKNFKSGFKKSIERMIARIEVLNNVEKDSLRNTSL